MAILEASRVILRPFRAEDVDLLSELMADQDFMRFSLGVYTREQTLGFLEKVLTWEREGLPSQFAVEIKSEGTLLGYCGFFHQDVDGKSEARLDIPVEQQIKPRELFLLIRNQDSPPLSINAVHGERRLYRARSS